MTAAVYYHPDGFDTSRPRLMGRHAAGEAFLAALARHGRAETLYCYAATRAHFDDFCTRLGAHTGKRKARWIPFDALPALAEPGCLFLPQPTLGEAAWSRRFADQRCYSLCGITHTTATHAVMDCIGDFLIAPVQPWDALICTSAVVKATVARLLDDWGDYLARRMGGRPAAPVRLEVIPLGVDSAALAPSAESARARDAFRRQHGIGEADLAVLFFGRLNAHAKANPLPMYLGLERAARASGLRTHLILAGWFANKAGERAFVEAAERVCPSVRVLCVDGRVPAVRRWIWAAADMFTSLSDNVQETFGLTPLEAMAAGLPVVVSDWNGYRDTVRDGEDGFTVPTRMPPAGLAPDLGFRYHLGVDSYDHYVGKAGQYVSVDVDAAGEAYLRLMRDAALRRRMGEAGRRRARELFDWKVIIAAYEALWDELAGIRRTERELAPREDASPAHPLRGDPFHLFESYPSRQFAPDDRVMAVPGVGIADFRRLRELRISRVDAAPLIADRDCEHLLDDIDRHGGRRLSELLEPVTGARRARLHRALAWLAKLGLVRIETEV